MKSVEQRPDSLSATSHTLVQQVREGDERAWSRLCDLYGPVVYHWLKRRNLRHDAISDIGQEVLLAVHQNIGEFRREKSGDSFRGWLWTITRNKHADYVRRELKHPHPAGGTDHQGRLEQFPEQVPPEEPGSADSRDAIVTAVCASAEKLFKKRTWQVFIRTQIKGQSYSDVAAELGMEEHAARQAAYRVRKRLKDEYGDLEDFLAQL